MASIIDRIVNLFDTPQGNLIVFLILVLFAFGAYQACTYSIGRKGLPEGKRLQQGLLSLLIAQVVLFLASWLAWLGIIEEHAYLPLLDRIVALFGLVLIIWLWAFPKRTPKVDEIFLVIEAIIILAGVISLAWWFRENSGQFFNTSSLGAYAYYAGIAFLIAGVILLFWKRPNSWGIGLSMLVLFLGGYLAQFLLHQPAGNYAWLVRIGEMIAFVLLLELPRRLSQGGEEIKPAQTGKAVSPIQPQVDLELLQEITNLFTENSPPQFLQSSTQVIARMMGADTCLLSMPPRLGSQLIILTGYNLPDERVIDGFTVTGQKMPLLSEALLAGKSLRLDGSTPESEVDTLTLELGQNNSAHLLCVPFKVNDSNPAMGILVLSSITQRVWSESDEAKLSGISREISRIYPHPAGMYGQDRSIEVQQEELQRITQEAEIQLQDNEKIETEHAGAASQAVGVAIGLGGTAAWLDNQADLQETLRTLEERNRELEILVAKGRPSIEEVEQLREELRAALTDLARVPTTLSKSDQRMLELQLSTMKQLDDIGQGELVTSIAHEFRQPLSAIIGYTDLLLGESVGLLGAMQKKFLERVKASTERLAMLMNELVQILTIDSGKVDQTLTRVDLESVVDDAVGNIIAQISEKNISMRVDLPEQLPEIRANREALQQILANLLENACMVTPEDGEIRLVSRIERREGEPNLLLISVTDQGGGVAKEDIPRIFTRRYKVENPLIQGIGDTGVGLSIVKSLVELQKGRVWVDTQEGHGSTFSALIPLIEDQTEQVNPGNP